MEGRTDGSVTTYISLRNFVGEGITKLKIVKKYTVPHIAIPYNQMKFEQYWSRQKMETTIRDNHVQFEKNQSWQSRVGTVCIYDGWRAVTVYYNISCLKTDIS